MKCFSFCLLAGPISSSSFTETTIHHHILRSSASRKCVHESGCESRFSTNTRSNLMKSFHRLRWLLLWKELTFRFPINKRQTRWRQREREREREKITMAQFTESDPWMCCWAAQTSSVGKSFHLAREVCFFRDVMPARFGIRFGVCFRNVIYPKFSTLYMQEKYFIFNYDAKELLFH